MNINSSNRSQPPGNQYKSSVLLVVSSVTMRDIVYLDYDLSTNKYHTGDTTVCELAMSLHC